MEEHTQKTPLWSQREYPPVQKNPCSLLRPKRLDRKGSKNRWLGELITYIMSKLEVLEPWACKVDGMERRKGTSSF